MAGSSLDALVGASPGASAAGLVGDEDGVLPAPWSATGAAAASLDAASGAGASLDAAWGAGASLDAASGAGASADPSLLADESDESRLADTLFTGVARSTD